jgi:hypothetical protein
MVTEGEIKAQNGQVGLQASHSHERQGQGPNSRQWSSWLIFISVACYKPESRSKEAKDGAKMWKCRGQGQTGNMGVNDTGTQRGDTETFTPLVTGSKLGGSSHCKCEHGMGSGSNIYPPTVHLLVLTHLSGLCLWAPQVGGSRWVHQW